MANIGYGIIYGMSRGNTSLKPWSEITKSEPAKTTKTGKQIFDEICDKALNKGVK